MSDLDYKPRGSTVVITNAVLLSFTAIFVFVRLYVRVFLLNQVGIDDVLIWVASVFGFLLSIVEIMSMYRLKLQKCLAFTSNMLTL